MASPSVDDLYLHVPLSSLVAAARRWAWVASPANRDKDEAGSEIWAFDQGSGVRQITDDGYGPLLSDDGLRIAFLRSVDGAPQVFVHDDVDGAIHQVTHGVSGIASLEQWDTGRHRLLARIRDKPGGNRDEPLAIRHLPYKQDGMGVLEGTVQLHCIDMRLGRTEPLVRGDGDVLEACWSPDGRVLAHIRRRGGRQQHWMDLWIQQGDEPARQVTDALPSLSGLSWAPDGSRIAFAASVIEGDSVSHLHLFTLATGAVEAVGHIEMAIPTAIQWDVAGERLLTLEAYCGLQRIVMADLHGTVTPLWECAGRQATDMAASDGEIGFLAMGIADGPEFHMRDPSNGHVACVSRFNAWRGDRPSLDVRERTFRVPDGEGGGEDIHGWLLVPGGSGPFPLLLDMHGGPHSMVSFGFVHSVHWPLLLHRGWAILALNSVGSSSYGDAFASRLCGHWGERDLPQWQAAVEQLRGEGIAGTGVACFGHSYGGYLSAWALAHDRSLIAGIVSAGIINLESHTGTSDSGYYVGPYSMCGELDELRGRYRELSPISHAAAIQAPTLILQGQDDERCPVGQGEELLAALIRRGGVEVEMLLFPGGSHHVSSTGRPSHRTTYFRRLVDWLERARARAPGNPRG